ncbi:MAG: zinc ribbon domain-containing protein [Firmicutes bacterium]|nr:zinc ribbon domain-containing protein [Bacillota bacterium]
MKCKNCGVEVTNGSQVCSSCGKNIEVAEQVVVTPVIESQNVSDGVAMFNKEYESEKPKSKVALIIIIIVALLVIVIGGAFYFLRSPKMILTKTFNQVFATLENSIVTFDTIKGSLSIEVKFPEVSDEETIQSLLNDMFINIGYEIDYKGKTSLVSFNTKYDNGKLLDADVYLKNNKGYVLLDGLYDKYISVDLENTDSIYDNAGDTDSQKTLFLEVKNAITKSLKSEYFEKSNTEIVVGAEKVKVAKNSLVVNSEMLKDILNILKENDNFLESAANVSNITKQEVIEQLEDILDELNDKDNYLTISVYTKGLVNDVVAVEFATKSETVTATSVANNQFKFDFIGEEDKFSGVITLTTKNKQTVIDLEIKDVKDETMMELILGVENEYNVNLKNVDVSNNIDVYSLTEEDSTQILMSLMEQPGVIKLIEQLNDLSFGYEDNLYGDDYYEEDYYIDTEY